MKTYNVWHMDKPVEKIHRDDCLPLEDMQKLVGGYIEIHKLGKTFYIMDEEGLLKGKQPNPAFPQFVGTVITTQDGVE